MNDIKYGNENEKGGGRRGKTNSNLFQKLAVCGYSVDSNDSQFRCVDNNRPMAYVNKDKVEKGGKYYRSRYLQCSASKSQGGKCKGIKKYYPYDAFETAFLTHIDDISVSTLFGTEEKIKTDLQKINSEIEKCKNSIESSEQQIAKYLIAMDESESISESMSRQLAKHENDAAESKNQLENLEQQKIAVEKTTADKNDIKYQLSSMIEHMAICKDEADLFSIRVKLSALLKKYISRIEVYNNGSSGQNDPVGMTILNLRERYANENMLDEENRKRIDEYEKDLQQMQKTSRGGIDQPYFVVRYLSGNSRLVLPSPNDPTKIKVQILTDSEQNILTTYAEL
jgi:DNA repair exonuclease SbcCD ATPase subunit